MAAGLLLGFGIGHVRGFVETGRPIGLGLAAQELITAALFMIRRPPRRTTTSWKAWGVAIVGGWGVLAVRPGGANLGWNDSVGLAVQGLGAALTVIALLTLGRAFGIVAADRGIVDGGPYRLIRHPVYAAGFVGATGYLIQSLTPWNVAVVGVTWCFQVLRMLAEERLLAASPAYAAYVRRVRWRVLPGVF